MRISAITKGPRRMRRVAHIARKLASHGLGFVVYRLDLRRHLPTWLRVPGLSTRAEPEDLPRKFAAVLEELGPTFVKFGQMLATRPDILPPAYVQELERIYHHVAPFPGETARRILEDEFGQSVEDLFARFESEPAASGSIAQVHHATLLDGTPVVVKVRRPRIESVIEDDLAILAFLAEQADRVEEFQPFRLPMLVEEFGRGISRELDFVAEAAFTHKFREAFAEDQWLEMPQVFWDRTTPRVLTMRRLEGTHLNELLRQEHCPWDRRELARRIMDAYLRQFFILGFFHGDPHPGNILITPQGKVALLDFGLVGRVSARLRRDLGICLMALGNEQLELVADVMSDLGRLPDPELADPFQEQIVRLLERYTGVPLDNLDFQRSFYEVMDVVRSYRVDVPRDFVLMGRTLVVISGLVTQMDPALNVGELAKPYARKLARQKLSATGIRRSLTSGGYHLGTLLADAPRHVRRFARELREGRFEFAIRHEGFDEALGELDKTGNRLSLSILLAAIIMASAQLLQAEIGVVSVFRWRVSVLGLVGFATGFLLGVWLIWSILRSRSL